MSQREEMLSILNSKDSSRITIESKVIDGKISVKYSLKDSDYFLEIIVSPKRFYDLSRIRL